MVQGNGFALSDLKVDQISGDTKQAVVWVQFKNFGKDETVIFNLIHDDQSWMIDEIISARERNRLMGRFRAMATSQVMGVAMLSS